MASFFSCRSSRRSDATSRLGSIMAMMIAMMGVGYSQELQISRLDNGLLQLESEYLRLITDLPRDESIERLPLIFDRAIEQWCKHFQLDRATAEGAKVVACLMHDRARFVRLELMPAEVGTFRSGYQVENRLFMSDQPTDYYRRHLLLHEGTHWFMWRYLGGNGPPWFSEGVCELVGTHRWDGSELKLGVIPDDPEQFLFWGRLRLIQQELRLNNAPSLDEVLRYSDTAHRTDEPYAWCWAALVFLSNHAKYRSVLAQVAHPPLEYSHRITRDLKQALQAEWEMVEIEWRLFVSELDFGFSPEHSMIDGRQWSNLPLPAQAACRVQTDRGWQSTGYFVKAGDRIQFKAQGRFVIRSQGESSTGFAWESEPQGVTVEYYRGQPLGKLLAAIAPRAGDKSVKFGPLHVDPIGKGASIAVAEDGWLLLKINEHSAGLRDNRGELEVSIARDAP